MQDPRQTHPRQLETNIQAAARQSGGATPSPGARAAGSTLVELLLGLAVAGVLLRLALPLYSDWIADYQLLNHAQLLAGSMTVARTEAVKRAFHVHLCKSPDRQHCVTSGTWASGFIVYVDENGDGRADAGELLRIEGPASPGITVVGNAPVEDYVSYTSLGTARLDNGALQMGTFTVCRSGRRAIDVVLANSGRVRIQKSTLPCP